MGANLKGAHLCSADLTGANLEKADLTEANLSGAILNSANLCSSDRHETKLIGANLSNVKLWKAILYPENKFPKQYLREKPSVDSIGEFLEIIRKVKNWYVNTTNTKEEVLIYFRGEPKCGWPLTPSVVREDFVKHESDMLLDLVSRRPEEFNGLPYALAQIVLAQHHELKTRLLDVSKNPLVALFNACGGYKDDAKNVQA